MLSRRSLLSALSALPFAGLFAKKAAAGPILPTVAVHNELAKKTLPELEHELLKSFKSLDEVVHFLPSKPQPPWTPSQAATLEEFMDERLGVPYDVVDLKDVYPGWWSTMSHWEDWQTVFVDEGGKVFGKYDNGTPLANWAKNSRWRKTQSPEPGQFDLNLAGERLLQAAYESGYSLLRCGDDVALAQNLRIEPRQEYRYGGYDIYSRDEFWMPGRSYCTVHCDQLIATSEIISRMKQTLGVAPPRHLYAETYPDIRRGGIYHVEHVVLTSYCYGIVTGETEIIGNAVFLGTNAYRTYQGVLA